MALLTFELAGQTYALSVDEVLEVLKLPAEILALPRSDAVAVGVVPHMPATFTAALARRLDTICALHVEEVAHTMPLRPGIVYVAAGDADIVVAPHGKQTVVRPVPAAPELSWHPNVDRLVDSAIGCFGAERLVGVLLTGLLLMHVPGLAGTALGEDGGVLLVLDPRELVR